MADTTVTANAGSGGDNFAIDKISSVDHPYAKIEWGPSGTANVTDTASGKALPVQVRSATGLIPIGEPTDAKSTATDTTSVTVISALKQISASVQAPPSQAVTNTGIFAVQADTELTTADLDTGAGTDTRAVVGLVFAASGGATPVSVAAGLPVQIVGDAVGSTTDTEDGTVAGGQSNVALTISQTHAWDGSNWKRVSLTTGLSASATFTPGSSSHAAGDCNGAAGTFALGAISGSSVLITDVTLEIDGGSVEATAWRLYLYSVTPPSATADDGAWDLASGDRASFLGYLDVGTAVDLGSTQWVQQAGVNRAVRLSGTSVYGYLINLSTLMPANVAHKVALSAIQL